MRQLTPTPIPPPSDHAARPSYAIPSAPIDRVKHHTAQSTAPTMGVVVVRASSKRLRHLVKQQTAA